MNMNKFWELLEQSVITQSLITFMVMLTLCVMFIQGRVIPEFLTYVAASVLYFWMGSKVGYLQGTKKATIQRKKASKDE